MSTFLFASIAIEAHTSNPLPIAARLVERGHEVVWYAGARFHARIAAIGATPVPYVDAPDFSDHDLFEYFPQLAGKAGPKVIGTAFDEIFVGHAPDRVSDLRRVIAEQRRLGRPVAAMLADELSYGVGFTSEIEGIPWATFGDGPLGWYEPDTPPFGPGLLPMRGPIGRLRNRVVRVVARRVIFRKAERTFHRIRRDLGLPRVAGGPLDAILSPMLHLHGCTPAFEYPRRALPHHIHWVGALKPDPPRTWSAPEWWGDLGDGRPVIHVTQGSLRPDMNELVLPTLRALADEPVLVVVTTGGPTAADVEADYGEPLPSNCLVSPWIPYDELLARARVFVTNGGYTGVTLALSHGVPIVQAGTTEEKAEIAARIQWSGVGLRLGATGPSPAKVRRAVRHVLDDPSFTLAAQRVQAEMASHDAGNEAADLLEHLVVGTQRVVASSR